MQIMVLYHKHLFGFKSNCIIFLIKSYNKNMKKLAGFALLEFLLTLAIGFLIFSSGFFVYSTIKTQVLLNNYVTEIMLIEQGIVKETESFQKNNQVIKAKKTIEDNLFNALNAKLTDNGSKTKVENCP